MTNLLFYNKLLRLNGRVACLLSLHRLGTGLGRQRGDACDGSSCVPEGGAYSPVPSSTCRIRLCGNAFWHHYGSYSLACFSPACLCLPWVRQEVWLLRCFLRSLLCCCFLSSRGFLFSYFLCSWSFCGLRFSSFLCCRRCRHFSRLGIGT